ncbi:MAG: hypothetical protein M1825_003750 [Sarcosagium campestre]|nr:MAG: hypothetical protein M1825_003750 [Sarcosagium campestre]
MTPIEAADPYHHRELGQAARDQSFGLGVGLQSTDPSLLGPEHAFAQSPPRKTVQIKPGQSAQHISSASATLTSARSPHRRRDADRGRSGSRRKRVWKKLLWVKQNFPDNYTDQETFLDHLQLNPRRQPYDFWPLVADSTVIVQHVCSVIIFVCCFAGIFQERVSPVAVVGWGSISAVLGWVAWDWWMGREGAVASSSVEANGRIIEDGSSASSMSSSFTGGGSAKEPEPVLGLGLTIPVSGGTRRHSHSGSAASMHSSNSPSSPGKSLRANGSGTFGNQVYYPPYGASQPAISPRNQQRLATAKSAVLIYCALLGLSPILKSLTKSTTSDSIWAMSCWLMCINVFFFDYRGGVGVKFPASLSTNAALMASTVLASRLPSTTHVFSLTLFSIEVFGLFPAFRRHLRHVSWRGHLALTVSLVMGAGGGVGATISGGGWKGAAAGVILACLFTGLAMGGCSWWLIGLQKYKNEIHGPWDPARPVIRRHWD